MRRPYAPDPLQQRDEAVERQDISRRNGEHVQQPVLGRRPVAEIGTQHGQRGERISFARINRQRAARGLLARFDCGRGLGRSSAFGDVAIGKGEQPPCLRIARIVADGAFQQAGRGTAAVGKLRGEHAARALDQTAALRGSACGRNADHMPNDPSPASDCPAQHPAAGSVGRVSGSRSRVRVR